MKKEIEDRYLKSIIEDHIARHRGFRVQDLYKMLHQAAFGIEHLLTDLDQAREGLISEWETLDKVQKGESLLEVIDPEGTMIRINLRVLRKVQNRPLKLFEVMVESARTYRSDKQKLVRYWESVMSWSDQGEVPFGREEVEDLWIDMGCQGFPAVHHSETYTAANRPAYRIVMKSLWEGFTSDEADSDKA
jgi:hypothetical protein